MFFSIVIPLYNRPEEIRELLSSLLDQTFKDFETIIVEDGSSMPAKDIIDSFGDRLDLQYYFKENEGQGFARNYGFQHARGEFFIVFDSDIIIPSDYLAKVKSSIDQNRWDAFGGPDAAHSSFTPIQKAISYSMTSPFTTGGIRGNKKHVGKFHPRSFNMGISRNVWEKTGGYKLSRRSEDIEFSIRMINAGFKVGLIPEAFVYHKRRTSFSQFFKQTFNFGKGRIDIAQRYPEELKLVHAFPSAFAVGVICLALLNFLNLLTWGSYGWLQALSCLGNSIIFVYIILLFLHSLVVTKDLKVAALSVCSAFTQLMAYGLGFIKNYWDSVLLQNNTSQ